jgi:predicted nucleotidyltransferase
MGNELTESELTEIRGILGAIPNLERAVLFGSRATGQARHNSDVDIMLYGDSLRFRDVCRIQGLLDETNIPYLFDLIMHKTTKNQILLEDVRKCGREIYSVAGGVSQ